MRNRYAVWSFIVLGMLWPSFVIWNGVYADVVATTQTATCSIDDLLDAIHMTEASGKIKVRDGDGGKAIGPMQIWRDYWLDATHEKRVVNGKATWVRIHPGDYQDCRRLDYAKQVVLWYMQKYAPVALKEKNLQHLARVHNGGPQGHRVRATIPYWHKVRKHLK